MKLTEAGNTYNYAIYLLIQDGFEVKSMDTDDEIFIASRNQIELKSDNPLSLLSLSFIHNETIEDWRKSNHIDDDSLLGINFLMNQGLDIKITREYSEDWFNFIIKNDDIEIIAQTSLNLLGLYLIYKKLGKKWRDLDIPNYLNEILD